MGLALTASHALSSVQWGAERTQNSNALPQPTLRQQVTKKGRQEGRWRGEWLAGQVGWALGQICLPLFSEARLRGRERPGSDGDFTCSAANAPHPSPSTVVTPICSQLGSLSLSPPTSDPRLIPSPVCSASPLGCPRANQVSYGQKLTPDHPYLKTGLLHPSRCSGQKLWRHL